MTHVLILGMTESGKTTVAKRLCDMYRSKGIDTLVLDPMNDPNWNATFKTKNPDEFLNMIWNSLKCACFVDEAGDAIGRYNTIMEKTATKGRHWGHRFHYITQRGTQISRTVRDQCSQLYLFRSGLTDRKTQKEDWDCDALINPLDLGECYHVGRNGKSTKIVVFKK